MQGSPQSVFLDVFSLPDHNSKLYFFKKGLVQALGNLSTFAVQHYSKRQEFDLVKCRNSAEWNQGIISMRLQSIPGGTRVFDLGNKIGHRILEAHSTISINEILEGHPPD